MYKLYMIMALFLALAGSADAQAKNPFKSKEFWLGTLVEVGSAMFDAHTTNIYVKNCKRLYNGVGCGETNPLLGKYPSPARVYLTGAAFIGGKRLLIAWIWKQNQENGRIASAVSAGGHAAFHVYYGNRNLKLNRTLKRGVCPARGAGCAE